MSLLGDDSTLSVDTQDSAVEHLKINGHKAIYTANGSTQILFYETNEYALRLISDSLDQKELKKIAENLENLQKFVVK